MNDADQHLMTIFSGALDRDGAGERSAFLDEACAGDPELRRRVEALLLAHDRPGAFLGREEPKGNPDPDFNAAPDATESESTEPGQEGVGVTIGPYRLLQVIGEGGMGTVYMAEQAEPIRRRVALKVVRPGMDSRQVLARFEAERQALAMMEHPNIARVLDAGTTPAGRPFFAMELVKGVPITRFCDERRLTPRERIELFLPVCQAVQHAHQKGIIHRDLKPSNVLVALYDDRPVAKVIDFGIAKATGPQLGEHSVFTEFGAIIGTLEYMSPEQAQLNQLDIDTRSDVYSLGVLLYELLTGTTPMDRKSLGQAALLDVLKSIREAETPLPSHRLSTSAGLPSIAASRGLEPRKLSGLVRGDLDWIVMKALEKERSRRYETANALSRDLQRYLNDEDVEASPPSPAYRFRKFARRHRTALAVGGLVAASLVIATAVSTWQAVRATRAESAAIEAAEVERLTTSFFIDDLLGKASLSSQVVAGMPPDPNLRVRDLVDRAAARIDGRFAGQPLVEAAVRQTIGRVYDSLGLDGQARPYFERSNEIRRQVLGEDDPATLHNAAELGQCESNLGQHDRAEQRLRGAIELASRLRSEDARLPRMLLGTLAKCLEAAGQHDEADAAFRRAIELAASPEVLPYHRLVLRNNHAISLINRGDERGAEVTLSAALREALDSVGEDHPLVPLFRINLALIERNRGEFRQAEPTARKALEGCRKLFGERHPSTLAALRNVGLSEFGLGRNAEAEATLRSALELARQGYGPDSEPAVHATTALADILRDCGKLEEADLLLRGCLEPARRLGPAAEANVEGNLGMVCVMRGHFPEAERLLRKARDTFVKLPSPEVRFRLALERDLGVVLSQLGRHREACEQFRVTIRRAEATFGPDDIQIFHLLSGLVTECRILGQDAEAEAIYPRLIRLGETLLGPEARNTLAVQQAYAAFLHVRGQFDAAEGLYRRGLEGFRKVGGPADIATWQTTSNLGELYRDWGRPDDAVPLFNQALDGYRKGIGPDHPNALWTLWKLAELERDRGRTEAAGPMFERCLKGYARAQGNDGLELAMLRADLAMNHLRANRPDRAEPLLREALRAYEKQLPDDWRRYEIVGLLGEALAAQGKYAEAEPLVLEGCEGLEARRDRVTVDAWSRRPLARQRVVRLYEAWGKPVLAEAWKKPPAAAPPGKPEPRSATKRTPP